MIVDSVLPMAPITRHAADGSWLALSPIGYGLHCGAWGATEVEAIDAWMTRVSGACSVSSPVPRTKDHD